MICCRMHWLVSTHFILMKNFKEDWQTPSHSSLTTTCSKTFLILLLPTNSILLQTLQSRFTLIMNCSSRNHIFYIFHPLRCLNHKAHATFLYTISTRRKFRTLFCASPSIATAIFHKLKHENLDGYQFKTFIFVSNMQNWKRLNFLKCVTKMRNVLI